MILITPDEARMLARAIRQEAEEARVVADTLPPVSVDPLTRRYEFQDKAYNLGRRAKELCRLAVDAEHDMKATDG